MKKIYIFIIGLITIMFISLIDQFFLLKKAHSSFENYYTFRGCTKLLKKTGDYGICYTTLGETIKIVRHNNKWYLDGDLPWRCTDKICFGI